MKVVVQRVKQSSVVVDKNVVGKIDKGLLVLVGFTEGDDLSKIEYLAKKVVNLRIFPDENDVMNKSILDDIEGIGEVRKKQLLNKFKTIKNLRNASLEELKEVLPNNVAENLLELIGQNNEINK